MKRSVLLAALAVCCAVVFGAARAQGEVAPPLTPGHYLGLFQNGPSGDGGPLIIDLRPAGPDVRGLVGVVATPAHQIPVAVAFTSPETFAGSGRSSTAGLDFRGTSIEWFDRAEFRLQTRDGTTAGRMLFFRAFDNATAPQLPARWTGGDVDAALSVGSQNGNDFRGGLRIGKLRFPLAGSIGVFNDGVAPVRAVGLGDDGLLTLQARLLRTSTGPRLACEATVLADGSVRTVRFVLVPAT